MEETKEIHPVYWTMSLLKKTRDLADKYSEAIKNMPTEFIIKAIEGAKPNILDFYFNIGKRARCYGAMKVLYDRGEATRKDKEKSGVISGVHIRQSE